MNRNATYGQVLWLTISFFVMSLLFDLMGAAYYFELKNAPLSPNEYRGHIYGNKLSMPKRELDIVTGIIGHDPKYDGAVLMEEGNWNERERASTWSPMGRSW